MPYIKAVITSRILRWRATVLPRLRAHRQLLLRDQQFESATRSVEKYLIAVPYERQRTTGFGLRSNMQHHGAERGAAHARVRNTHHVPYSSFQEPARQRHVADFGHAGIALGPAALQHEYLSLI